MHTKKSLLIFCSLMACSRAYALSDEELITNHKQAELTDKQLIMEFSSDPDLKFLNFREVKGTLHRVVPVDTKKPIESQNLTETNLVSDQDSLQQAEGLDVENNTGLSEMTSTVPVYQSNPFDTPIDVDLKGVNTVGSAVGKILRYIGYDLKTSGVGIDPTAAIMFEKRVPNIHRRFKNVTVKEVVCALIGSGYTVVVDQTIRAVSADITPEKRRIKTMEERMKGGIL